MISINTNLSSFLIQTNLKQSTNKLTTAIERMSTGFRINHSKDNAANYGIALDMSVKISSLDIAEDNALMSLDMITTVGDSLELIERNVQRLRILQTQAMNNTMGQESLDMINMECNSIIDELNRLYLETEYNGINMFLETTIAADGSKQVLQEVSADETTTFKELDITSSTFSIYDKYNNLIQTYDVEGDNTIDDFFATIETHDITGEIISGRIELNSTTGNYIAGALMDELGITTKNKTYVDSTSQTSSIPVTYESVTSSTTEELVYRTTTTSTTQTSTIWVTTTTETTQTNTILVTTTATETQTTTIYTTTTSEETRTETVYVTTTTPNTVTETIYTTTTTSNTVTETISVISTVGLQVTSSSEIPASNVIDAQRVSKVSDFNSYYTFYISTTEDLVALQNLVNSGATMNASKVFILTNDIDMSGVEFRGIGTSSNPFAGYIKGNGYVISNLTINTTEDYVGLIAYSEYNNAKCYNLGLENVNITGGEYVGSFIGYGYNSGLFSCYVTGTVSGESHVGGLAGHTVDIHECYSEANVSGSGTYIGGLAGRLGIASGVGGGTSYNCYSTGNITGHSMVGGLCGIAVHCNIYNSYTTGNVTGHNSLGGLAGYTTGDNSIRDSYATGNVTGSDNYSYNLGGLVGEVSETLSTSYTYATGTINGYEKVGGLIGFVNETTSYSTSSVSCTRSAAVQADSYATLSTIESIKATYTNEYMNFTEEVGWDLSGDNPTLSLANGIRADKDTVFSSIGITTDQYITVVQNGTTKVVTVTSSQTIGNMITNLGKVGITASITNSTLKFNASNTNYIVSISDELENKLRIGGNYSSVKNTNTETIKTVYTTTTTETTETETVFVTTTTETTETETVLVTTTTETTETETIFVTTTTETTETETIYTTTTSSTTNTETLWETTTTSSTQTVTTFTTTTEIATGANTLEDLGLKNGINLTVFQDGTKNILNLTNLITIDEFVTQLIAQGFTADFTNNKLTINGVGDSYIFNRSIESAFKLQEVDKDYKDRKVNTNSNRQSYEKNILPELGDIYAPGNINMQIGTNFDENSRLNIQTSFKLSGYNDFRQIGKTDVNYLDQIDDLLNSILTQQTQIGAMQNRLVSVLEEITIKRDNLVSSRSTIRDADIAELSSEYIQQQILQQASATLLSTANQTPSIALQLI